MKTKQIVTLLSFIFLGWAALTYQLQIAGTMSSLLNDPRSTGVASNLLAGDGDPASTWCLYREPQDCAREGRVYCQDAGGPMYVIPGATVKVKYEGWGTIRESNIQTDANGIWKYSWAWPPTTTMDSRQFVDADFVSRPAGNLPNGLPYTQMIGPDKLRVNGPNYSIYVDFKFTNCSQPPPQPSCGQKCTSTGPACLPYTMGGIKPWTGVGITAGWLTMDSKTFGIIGQDKYWNKDVPTNKWTTSGTLASNAWWKNAPAVSGQYPWGGSGITAGWVSSNNILTVISKDKFWSKPMTASSTDAWSDSGPLAGRPWWNDAPAVGGQKPWEGVGITAGWFTRDFSQFGLISKDKYWTKTMASNTWTGSGLLKDNPWWNTAPAVGGQKPWEGVGITAGWVSQNNILTVVSKDRFWSKPVAASSTDPWTASGMLAANEWWVGAPGIGGTQVQTVCDTATNVCEIPACAGPGNTCVCEVPPPTPTPFVSTPTPPMTLITVTRAPSVTPKPSSSPTPTKPPVSTPTKPVSCTNCNYQVDLYWGPVIKSFALGPDGTGPRYSSPVRRLVASASDAPDNKNVGFPACPLTPMTYQPVTIPTLPSGCTKPVENKYLVGSVKLTNLRTPAGYVEATIENRNTNAKCVYPVGLATYKAAFRRPYNETTFWQDIYKQNLFDNVTYQLKAGQKITLRAKSPVAVESPQCHKLPAQ